MNKVVHLFCPGPFGGAEKVIIKGLEKLKERIPLTLLIIKESRCPEYADFFEEECQRVHINTELFESKGVFNFTLLNELKKRTEKDYIIHTHGMKATFYGAFLPGKLLVTHHGNTSHTIKVRVYEFIQEVIMRKADRVISVSTTMKEELDRKNIKSSLVENMLSIKPIAAKTPNDETTHFVFIGRLSLEKGADVLVNAFKNVTDAKLSILGEGIEREKLETQIKENNIKNITFYGFQSDITKFIKDADALVMPSLREGLPMTLLEAICCGVPVIGSDVGGLKDLVKQNGILVPPGDATALTKAITIFIARKEEFTNNASSMSENFIKRFSVENWCDKTIEIYKRLSNQS